MTTARAMPLPRGAAPAIGCDGTHERVVQHRQCEMSRRKFIREVEPARAWFVNSTHYGPRFRGDDKLKISAKQKVSIMSAILLTAPAAEPWSVADAKAFLRVEHDDDDAIIAALIAAARNHVEALTRRGADHPDLAAGSGSLAGRRPHQAADRSATVVAAARVYD